MDKELIDLVPLVRDELSDIRYGLHKSMVQSIVSDMKIGDQTSAEDIRKKAIKKFNIAEFPREVLSRIMHEFEDEGILQKHDGSYVVANSIEIQSINIFVDNCYKEFTKILKSNITDFDPYINKEFKSAFEECIFYIINILIEQKVMNKVNLDFLKYEEISMVLKNGLIKYKTIKNPDQFLSLFYDYLKSGENYITELLFIVYQSSVAYDLLRRGRRLPKIAEHVGKGGVLFLDTNVIVSLICKTDRTHDLAKSVVKLAENLFHFTISYCKETSIEFENLLKWADSEMKSGRLPSKIAAENQLILDFTKRTACRWSDYYTELSMYRTYLKSEFNIDLFDNCMLEFNEKETEIINYVDAIYSYAFQQYDEKRERSRDALTHDKNLFRKLICLKKSDACGLNTPWILSFDNILNGINLTLINIDRFKLPEGGYSIHPRILLNTLLVFENIDFNEDKRKDFVRSIVNYLIIPSSSLTEEQYAKLIAYKVPGLGEKDIDTILHFFRGFRISLH